MLQLKNPKQSYAINLPTRTEEIDSEYLKSCVKGVNLSENYAIVALVVSTKLTDFVFSLNGSSKESKMSAMPLFVKAATSKDVKFEAKTGDVVIIRDEELMRSTHLSVPCVLTSQSVGSYIKSNDDFVKAIMTGELKNDKGESIGSTYVKLLQFKLVPICDIHATINPEFKLEDKHIVKQTAE